MKVLKDSTRVLKVATIICTAVSWAMLAGVFVAYGMTRIMPVDELILSCCLMGLANVGLLVLRFAGKPKAKK